MAEKLEKILEKVNVKLCEKLPFDFTIYEKDGLCKKPNEICDYCKKDKRDASFFCVKKDYTQNYDLRFI